MSNPIVQKINGLSTGMCWLVSLALLGVYYGVMYDSGSTAHTKIDEAKKSIEAASKEIKSLEKAEADAKAYQETLKQMGERLQQVTKYIPEELTDFDLMGILSSEAKAAGASISNIVAATAAVDTSSIYQEVGVSVQLKASYTQLLQFLSYITRADKIIVLKAVTMRKTTNVTSEGEALLDFDAQFAGYRYSKNDEKKAAK